jgi:WD40 repeat protein
LTWSGEWGEGTAVVWDAGSGERLLTLSHEGEVWGVAWNQDESRILTWSGDNTAVVWDAASGERLQTLFHDDWVRGAAWNEDENRILTGSDDGAAKIWDVETGRLLWLAEPDGKGVTTARWNKGEDRLLVTTAGGAVRIYYTDIAELLSAACRSATRNFTWAEWLLYFPGEPYRQTCPNLPPHPSVP